MSTILNVAENCESDKLNTGFTGCDTFPSMEGVIEVPKNANITPAQALAIVAHIKAKSKADNKLERYFPFPYASEVTYEGGAFEKETLQNGETRNLRQNPVNLTLKYLDGGIAMNQALSSRNSKTSYYLFYSSSQVLGVRNDSGNMDGFTGKDLMAYMNIGTPAQLGAGYFGMILDAAQVNKQMITCQVEDGANIKTVEGLLDGNIVVTQALNAGGLVKVTVVDRGAGGIHSLNYATEFITGINFVATNTLTGNPITVTTVTHSGNGVLDITLSTADPDYPAVGGFITLKGAPVSTLEANGIKNIEVGSVKLTRV